MSFQWLRRFLVGGGHTSRAARMGCYGTFRGAALNVHPEPQLCLPRGPRLGQSFSASSPVTVWMKLASEKQLTLRTKTLASAALVHCLDAHFLHLQGESSGAWNTEKATGS